MSTPSEEPEPTKAPDLMAALEESLAAVRGEGDGAAKASESNGAKRASAKKNSAQRLRRRRPPRRRRQSHRARRPSPSRRPRPRLARSSEVTVGRRKLKLTNLDKVLYPKAGFTKAEVIDYYARVADVMIPHLRGRPTTLKRYPDGVEGFHFFEKRCPKHRPEWVKTATVLADRAGPIDFTLVDNKPTLIWLAQLAALELPLALQGRQDRGAHRARVRPGSGPPATIIECCRIALRLRDLFGELGMKCFPKTSGSKGMQVYVPLNGRVTYERTTPFAHRDRPAAREAVPKSYRR